MEGGSMEAYRREATIEQDGQLKLDNLPLQAGASVEVIILVQGVPLAQGDRYPLRGQPVTYLNPFEPVADSDWSALR
jgi:hypothetical protein